MFERAKQLMGWWLPVAVLCPSLIWVARDHAVWPWDQAWFARHTVELYEALRDDPLGWPGALVRATPLKPPAVVWIGQFFVPLGMAIGSVDAGLLLSIWMTHVAALMVVFRALLEMSAGRILVATAGTLVTGAAPLFIGLSTQYLAEATQTLAVAWFALIMICARRWGRSKLAAHLVAATSFAMLAKTTSPFFCAIPGMIALAALMQRQPPTALPRGRESSWPWWALAALLGVMAGAWYQVNSDTAIRYAREAALSPVAEYYGKRESFWRGLVEWCAMAPAVFFLRPVALLLSAFVMLAAARRLLARPSVSPGWHDVVAGAALLQVLLTLAVFALSPVREPRYLVALLPLVAVVVCWAIVQRGDGTARVVIGALGIQLALVESQVLGLWPNRPPILRADMGMAAVLHVVHRDAGPAADLAAIAQRTCAPGGPAAHNLVGVDLLHLNGHSLTYAAAKERLAGRAGTCDYASIGFAPVEFAEAELKAREYFYWIAVDPQFHPVPAYHEFLNRSAPVVFQRLRRRGLLEPEPWDGPKGVLLYRFVKR